MARIKSSSVAGAPRLHRTTYEEPLSYRLGAERGWNFAQVKWLSLSSRHAWKAWLYSQESLESKEQLFAFLFRLDEFRTLFDYRAQHSNDGLRFAFLYYQIYPRTAGLNIDCPEIGPRFRIQHGTSSWVSADRIGSDFWINQNVTIGWINGKRPVIGDRVSILTGAVAVGGITIGDDVTITANAVVNTDVPSESRVYAQRSVIISSREEEADKAAKWRRRAALLSRRLSRSE